MMRVLFFRDFEKLLYVINVVVLVIKNNLEILLTFVEHYNKLINCKNYYISTIR